MESNKPKGKTYNRNNINRVKKHKMKSKGKGRYEGFTPLQG